MSARPRMVAWAEAGHEPILRDLLARARVELVAAGGPTPADTADLAARMSVTPGPDLRGMLRDGEADLLWVGPGVTLDDETLRMIRDSAVQAVCGHPQPESVSAARAVPDEAATTRFAPLLRRSPGFLAARDVLAGFGPVDAINAIFLGTAADGPLVARLYDAMDLLDDLGGEVEQIDAALSGPPSIRPADRLGSLHGQLTAGLRFTRRGGASIVVSDAAGDWLRQVTLVGGAGTLTIDDDGFAWHAGGELVDRQRRRTRLRHGQLAGLQVRRMLDGHDARDPPPRAAHLLSLCEATRISCRTGQPESPRRALEMLSRL